ncbi:MAG: D-2-hydroxyacid dehydrogenase [Gammaproteobacteria bacterium]|nr:D-2-hydroxyacid dehydrogenase [Gammaproteobacteria bacterium]
MEILFGAPDRLALLLPHCDSLRWVQSSWAGVKPLIECPRRDYQLTGVKNIFGPPMTEFVLAWLLAFERRVVQRSQARSWDEAVDGHLYGKSLGVMGTGSLGSHLAAACQAVGLRVRGLNSDGRSIPNFDDCYSTASINEFADGLDYLVALLPDTPGSDRLIDAELLAQLKPGAILINGGRANVVDQGALIAALDAGQLAHAVLDVLNLEPLPDSDPLWQVPNLHITSHTAAVTIPEIIVSVFCENYRRYHGGRSLLHRIDFDKGY